MDDTAEVTFSSEILQFLLCLFVVKFGIKDHLMHDTSKDRGHIFYIIGNRKSVSISAAAGFKVREHKIYHRHD